jgi:hypothetical protein
VLMFCKRGAVKAFGNGVGTLANQRSSPTQLKSGEAETKGSQARQKQLLRGAPKPLRRRGAKALRRKAQKPLRRTPLGCTRRSPSSITLYDTTAQQLTVWWVTKRAI